MKNGEHIIFFSLRECSSTFNAVEEKQEKETYRYLFPFFSWLLFCFSSLKCSFSFSCPMSCFISLLNDLTAHNYRHFCCCGFWCITGSLIFLCYLLKLSSLILFLIIYFVVFISSSYVVHVAALLFGPFSYVHFTLILSFQISIFNF